MEVLFDKGQASRGQDSLLDPAVLEESWPREAADGIKHAIADDDADDADGQHNVPVDVRVTSRQSAADDDGEFLGHGQSHARADQAEKDAEVAPAAEEIFHLVSPWKRQGGSPPLPLAHYPKSVKIRKAHNSQCVWTGGHLAGTINTEVGVAVGVDRHMHIKTVCPQCESTFQVDPGLKGKSHCAVPIPFAA